MAKKGAMMTFSVEVWHKYWGVTAEEIKSAIQQLLDEAEINHTGIVLNPRTGEFGQRTEFVITATRIPTSLTHERIAARMGKNP